LLNRARQKLLTEILTDGEYLRERGRLVALLTGKQRGLAAKQAELSRQIVKAIGSSSDDVIRRTKTGQWCLFPYTSLRRRCRRQPFRLPPWSPSVS